MKSYWDNIPNEIAELILYYRNEAIKRERIEFIESLTEEELYSEIIKRNSLYSNFIFKNSQIPEYVEKNCTAIPEYQNKDDWTIRKEVQNHTIKYNVFNPNVITTTSVFSAIDIEMSFNNVLDTWNLNNEFNDEILKVKNFWINLDHYEQTKFVKKNFGEIKNLFLSKIGNWDYYECCYNLGICLFHIIENIIHDIKN